MRARALRGPRRALQQPARQKLYCPPHSTVHSVARDGLLPASAAAATAETAATPDPSGRRLLTPHGRALVALCVTMLFVVVPAAVAHAQDSDLMRFYGSLRVGW